MIRCQKMYTLGGNRTHNLWFRKPTPYPLGHEGMCVVCVCCMLCTGTLTPVDDRATHNLAQQAHWFIESQTHQNARNACGQVDMWVLSATVALLSPVCCIGCCLLTVVALSVVQSILVRGCVLHQMQSTHKG